MRCKKAISGDMLNTNATAAAKRDGCAEEGEKERKREKETCIPDDTTSIPRRN
jgi:hypothetical protein